MKPSEDVDFKKNGMCMCTCCLERLFGTQIDLGIALTHALGNNHVARELAIQFLKVQQQ